MTTAALPSEEFLLPSWYRKRGRHAVLLAEVPEGFRPTSPCDIPPSIRSAVDIERPLTMSDAVDLMRAHNQRILNSGEPVRCWAVILLRPSNKRPIDLDLVDRKRGVL